MTTPCKKRIAYDQAGRLRLKGYGNGDVVTQTYDIESRLLSMGITNNTTPVLWYTYGWDNGGNILAITNNNTNINLYAYDRAGQLTNEIWSTNSLVTAATNSWAYDEAGNWLNSPGAGTKWVYNKDNELIARASADETNWSATVTGTVEPGPNSNKWYNTWASCRGTWSQVGTNTGTFTLPNVPLYPGTNELLVTVTDVSGNSSTHTRKVIKTVTNCLETFQYDGNGNLTNWISGGTNWVYQWDWADRLTKVTANGIVLLENWYDAPGMRVAKKETVGGQIWDTLYVSDGFNSAAVLDEAGQILETYARGKGIAGDVGTLVAVAHHRGSSTTGTLYTHHNHRGDIVLTRTSATTLTQYEYMAFGAPQSVVGADSCRFKFSGKELHVGIGIYHFPYRLYDLKSQRWLSKDPANELAFRALGLASAMAALPSRGNSYGFVGNTPQSRMDPLGLVTFPAPGCPDGVECQWPAPILVEAAKDIAGKTGGKKTTPGTKTICKPVPCAIGKIGCVLGCRREYEADPACKDACLADCESHFKACKDGTSTGGKGGKGGGGGHTGHE